MFVFVSFEETTNAWRSLWRDWWWPNSSSKQYTTRWCLVVHATTIDIPSLTRDDAALVIVLCESTEYGRIHVWSLITWNQTKETFKQKNDPRSAMNAIRDFARKLTSARICIMYSLKSHLAALKLKNLRWAETNNHLSIVMCRSNWICLFVRPVNRKIAMLIVRFEFDFEFGTINSPQTTNTNVTALIVSEESDRLNFPWNDFVHLQVDGSAWRGSKIVENSPETNTPSMIKSSTITYAGGPNERQKPVADSPLNSNLTRSSLVPTFQLRIATESVMGQARGISS